METGEIEPPGARPLAGLPDPDVWSARWAVLLAVVSLVAWIVPTPYLYEDVDALYWVFPWAEDGEDAISLVWRLVQPAAALAAWLAVRRLRGTRRGAAVACVAFAALFANGWVAGVLGGPGAPSGSAERPPGADLALFLALVGGMAVAVGSHLRKRSPSGGPARALCFVGGLLMMLALVIPMGRRPMIAMLFDAEARRTGWAFALVVVLLLAYAFLGVRQLGAGPGDGWLTVWTSRLGRILLVMPPLGYIVTIAGIFADAPFQVGARLTSVVVPALKAWCTMVGLAGAFGVGVAAYLEGRIVDDAPRGLDPESAARAFD